jgi:hypothetical protein
MNLFAQNSALNGVRFNGPNDVRLYETRYRLTAWLGKECSSDQEYIQSSFQRITKELMIDEKLSENSVKILTDDSVLLYFEDIVNKYYIGDHYSLTTNLRFYAIRQLKLVAESKYRLDAWCEKYYLIFK